MKIISFYVEGLFDCREPISIKFNQNINQNIHVISGKNGAGKTTILKLVWYLISGNLDKALNEIPFKKAILETDVYKIEVDATPDDADRPFTTQITYLDRNAVRADIAEIDPQDLNQYVRHIITKFIGSSFFFPTFRNIEGGFTIEKYNVKHEIFKRLISIKNPNEPESNSNDLINSLKAISEKLSDEDHEFVTSVSSSHMNDFLISKYAEIMSLVQPYQIERKKLTDNFMKDFVDLTESKNNDSFTIEKREELLQSVKSKILQIEQSSSEIRQPLRRFHDSIRFFLKDYRFHFGKKVQFSKISETTVGNNELPNNPFTDEQPQLFDLSLLSAGEKQILTLIGYNAFIDNTIFFIDEPEISLHADWQRILFRILMKQNPTNQFIIATQSPFIYSKYPKNEICIDPTSDRGDSEE